MSRDRDEEGDCLEPDILGLFFWARESESELYHDFEMLHTTWRISAGVAFGSLWDYYTTLH